MTTTTREKFEEQFCFKQTDDWVTHYPSLRTNIDQTESIWSFIETIEKEAEERWKQKLATYIKENRNTVTLVQIEDLNPVIQYIVERIKALNSPEYEMENPDPIYELQAVLNKIKELWK